MDPIAPETSDEFARDAFGVLGVPINSVSMCEVVDRIRTAAASRQRLFLSTPNLNFLVRSVADPAFRNSLLASQLNIPDGVGVLLVCRLLGIPVRQRVAGADIPAALMRRPAHGSGEPLSVFIFGGLPGIANRACETINQQSSTGLTCAGALNPGSGTVEEMSSAQIIAEINASCADILIVALGARKGQDWLMQNRDRLRVPVFSHLGATINYLAGTVQRAPRIWQNLGLEWLWRIKEEPKLWVRYWHDAVVLLRILWSRVLPLALWIRWNNYSVRKEPVKVVFAEQQTEGRVQQLSIAGSATIDNLDSVRAGLRRAFSVTAPIVLDLSGLRHFDFSFLGLLLICQGIQSRRGCGFEMKGLSANLKRAFAWAGVVADT